MRSKKTYDIIGKTFEDRFGNKFIVLGLDHRDNDHVAHYKVRFLKTNYETTAVSSQIRHVGHAWVQDRMSPSVFGVGILGNAYQSDNPKMFDVWRAMIARCYNPKNPSYKTYGAKGVKVCDRWKRFDYFVSDIKNLPGYDQNKIDSGRLVLDKDIIDRSQMIYSPKTCSFITRSENTRESSLRRWRDKV